MSNNSLGDFFIKLGIIPDKNSFETGNKMIDGVSNALNRLMATARNAAVAMGTTAIITGKLETADIKAASAIGMKVEALDAWRTALKISGSDANSFISTISTLDTKFKKLSIDGTFDQNLAQSLGRLGLSYGDMAEMDSDTRTRKIIEAAQAMKDQEKASILIGDILGQAGREFYEYMKLSNVSLDQILARSRGSIFTSEETKRQSMEFNSEFQQLKETLGQISKLFGSEIGGGLTPVLMEINGWLQENRGTIKQLADDIGTIAAWAGKRVGVAAEGVGEAATHAGAAASAAINKDYGTAAEEAVKAAVDTLAASTSLLTGENEVEKFNTEIDTRKMLTDYADAQRAALKAEADGINGFKHPIQKSAAVTRALYYKPKYDELPEDIKAAVDATGGYAHYHDAGYLQDGIVRPNGQITHVAPDDWVLAARDLGSLASAFIPGAGAAAGGPVEISITQTFNVTGGNDMPQVLKQQAYKGTMDGLSEILQRAGNRMQLMPGLA